MDGMRCIAFVNGSSVKLLSRRGQNITAQYPALVAALPELCKTPMVIDGEIIALNEKGRPSFQLLQQRMNLLKVADIARADARIPVQYFVFDIVYADEYALGRCTLMDRKSILRSVLQQGSGLHLLSHFEDDGKLAYMACIENGFEGVVAKRKASLYENGRRSPSWIKIKGQKSSEFVIGGYSLGQGSRSKTFGSLVLGYYDEKENLVYAGSVGTGFDDRLLSEMLVKMTPLRTEKCPFTPRPEDKKDAIWLKPELVAEIKFMDWTDDKHLRNPVFLHLRYDILPADVKLIPSISTNEITGSPAEIPKVANTPATEEMALQAASTILKAAEATSTYKVQQQSNELDIEIAHWQSEAQAAMAQLGGKERNMSITVDHETISLTNLDKILFPLHAKHPAITKRDYLRLIAFLSPYLLTHMRYRPITMIRSPGGMRSKRFYQKHWNADIPDYLETIQTEPDDPTVKDQLLVNNIPSLIYLAQNGILEFHLWLSRLQANQRKDIGPLELPDYMTFDLDVHKEGESESDELDRDSFKKAADVAFKVKEMLRQVHLHPFLKTSGRNGLHLFVPIKSELKFEEVRTLAETISKHIEKQYPDLVSTNAVQARKAGRVFLDYTENTRGRTLSAPYSPRLTPGATISTPLNWEELAYVYPDEFNQHSIRDRINSKGDIWKDILSNPEDLCKRFRRES